MKKVLLSLFAAIVCLPIAFGQANSGHTVKSYSVTQCGSYTWPVNSQTYTSDTSVAVTIGDTIHVLDFTLDSARVDTANAVVLNGVCGVKWHDSVYTTAGTFIQTLHLSNGCDSVVKLEINLQVAGNVVYDTVDAVACDRFVTSWGDTVFASCDSTVVRFDSASFCNRNTKLTVTIAPSYAAALDTAEVTGGCQYTFGGASYSDIGVVHTATLTSVHGCDSVAAIRITALNGTDSVEQVVKGCGSYTWSLDGNSYNTDGIHYHTAVSDNCTTVTKLNLTMGDNYDTVYANGCQEYTHMFGSRTGSIQSYAFTVKESGVYVTDTAFDGTSLFPDSNLYSQNILTGCITHHTVIAVIKQPVQRQLDGIDTTVCNLYRYRHGVSLFSFTESADTVLTFSRHNDTIEEQCYDEHIQINVTVNKNSYHNDTASVCGSYTWDLNGKTYTQSGSFVDTVKVSVQVVVDSVVTIDSVLNDTSVVYYYETQDSALHNLYGCDSLGRLRLTINPSPEMTIEGDWMLEPGQQTTLHAVCSNITSGLRYQWYKDGVSAGTADSLVVEAPGTMSENSNVEVRLVTKTNRNCEAENWLTVTSNDMGIEGMDEVDVNIWPNPAVRVVNLGSSEVMSRVEVFNAVGQTVVSRTVDGTSCQLDLGSLGSGHYTLCITAANGKQTVRKLIVSK